MKLTKRTIWIVGFVIAAALIVIAARPKKDEIWIQLIDNRTGKPLTNVVVTNLALYRTPFAATLHLPYRFRFRSSSTVMLATNGAFSVQRISARSSLDSQQLTFALGKTRSGSHLKYSGPDFTYTADGIWQYGFKALGPGPIRFFVWQPTTRIEVPDHGPVILRLDPNADPPPD